MDYQLIRSRRKTLSLEIRPDGSLLVRAPARMPKREIDTFLLRKADWIQKHLPKAPPLPPFTPAENPLSGNPSRRHSFGTRPCADAEAGD